MSLKDYEKMLKEVTKGDWMGFVPKAMYELGIKPNILGSFLILFANTKGFSSSKISVWTGLKLVIRNIRWTLKARRNTDSEVPAYLLDLAAHVSSNASGCRYCQVHTAHTAHKNGVDIEKLQNVWEFETSDLFSEKEKAVLSMALAAGVTPNAVTEGHHKRLHTHFTKVQITQIVAYISVFGFLNRWNDTMATELEDIPIEFGKKNLSETWDAGRHVKV